MQSDGFAGIVDHVDPENHEQADALKVLASVGQGADLRNYAKVVGLPVNPGFIGDLVCPGAGPSDPFKLGDLELHVVGPLPDQLAELRKLFAKELPKGPASALAAYTDTSVPNLSSIVVLARFKGKTVLLTGDARGDSIIAGLKQAKLLDAQGKIKIDVLKMQHHGSDRDTADDFFTTIIADHYVASADGQYENPDRPTLEMLVKARAKTDAYTIHLTYEVADIDKLRKAERDKAVASAKAKNKSAPLAWNDKKDSLAALFADCKAKGHKFVVWTPKSGKRQIDLLAPITF